MWFPCRVECRLHQRKLALFELEARVNCMYKSAKMSPCIRFRQYALVCGPELMRGGSLSRENRHPKFGITRAPIVCNVFVHDSILEVQRAIATSTMDVLTYSAF